VGECNAIIGGALIEWSQNVALVYGWLGALTVVITIGFLFTPLGRLKQYGALEG
jgi:hypothetical protein